MFRHKGKQRPTRSTPLFGLAAAASFSLSAILIRKGLATGAPPLVGLWIGFTVSLLIYMPGFVSGIRRATPGEMAVGSSVFQVLAGVAITLAMWFRYIAMYTVPIGVVTALGRLNIPIILIVSPWLFKAKIDATSPRVWLGSILIVGGATMIVFLA